MTYSDLPLRIYTLSYQQYRKWVNLSKTITLFVTAIVFFALSSVSANAENINGVGIKKLEIIDPIDEKPMDAVAFYPSSEYSTITSIGSYQIAASKGISIGKDSYPLILLSHGNMGSMWGHHDFATFLAQQGYIVVSVSHRGDNFQDSSRVGKASAVYGRPLQVSAALSVALQDPVLKSHINKNSIGFLGFSAGGTTGLILAGGKPTFSRLVNYCAKHSMDNICEAKGFIEIDRSTLTPSADPRITSFVLLAPVSVIFAPEALQSITKPLLIFVGDKDEELSPDENAIALAKKTNSSLNVIYNAGHFTFLSPCTSDISSVMPNLCNDRKGIDRVSIHHSINVEIANFFKKTLNMK